MESKKPINSSMLMSKKGLGYRFKAEDMITFTRISGGLNQYYNMSEPLGEGSFGKIYKGTKIGQVSKIEYAIKQIDKRRLAEVSDTAEDDLRMEVSVQKKLSHPNIVKIHEVFENNKYFWIVQDFCEGGELFDCIIENTKYDEPDARKTFFNILNSVNHMHSLGYCHRDLKPENVLLLDLEDISSTMLIDFGFAAKFLDDNNRKIVFEDIVGTPSYQSPEVLNGFYTEKCDSFALGIILYILLAGGHPFQGKNDAITEEKILANQYSYKFKVFQTVSDTAKNLIDQFFKPQKDRISIKDALAHPWFNVNIESIHLDLDAFKQFVYSGKFKKLVIYRLCTQLNEKIVKQLGDIFNQIDKNHDGTISYEEFKKVVQEKLTQAEAKEIQEIFDKLDPDDNKAIDYNEFLASMLDKSIYLKRENLIDCFRMFDKNGDGKISKDEIKQELGKNQYFQNKSEKFYDDLLKEADKNGDGFIDFEEFKAMMEK